MSIGLSYWKKWNLVRSSGMGILHKYKQHCWNLPTCYALLLCSSLLLLFDHTTRTYLWPSEVHSIKDEEATLNTCNNHHSPIHGLYGLKFSFGEEYVVAALCMLMAIKVISPSYLRVPQSLPCTSDVCNFGFSLLFKWLW